jgi:DNA-binding NarL/FixJ family response regulator
VAHAEGVREAWEHPALLSSAVVVLDVAAAGADDFISSVIEATGARVVVCTSDCRDVSVLVALRHGAAGYLRKESLSHDGLQAAVTAVHAGSSVIVPELLAGVVGRADDTEDEQAMASSVRLVDRERQVLGLIADGLPTREVAQQLNYSERTVKSVLHDVVTKLNARSRSQAVAQAVRDGLI